MHVLPECMHAYHMCIWYPQRPEKDKMSPGIGVTVINCSVAAEKSIQIPWKTNKCS